MFHVAYLAAGESSAERPVTFVFNGGPGASSAYLHVGALGPRRVVFHDDGSVPAPPARLVDNEQTWLRFTDLVFVDPVGTGFSRAIHKGSGASDKSSTPSDDKPSEQEFFALNRDLDSLGDFIQRFLSKHHRWTSPVFIAGESYGGFRAAKLSSRLQQGFGVGLCGTILISPAFEWSLLVPSDYEVPHFVDTFPTMAAAAHVHGRCGEVARDMPLQNVLERAETFATGELAELLFGNPHLDESRGQAILDRLASWLGLDAQQVRRSEGRIRRERFVRELLRDQERICGLYDATLTARDPFPDRDPAQAPDPTLFSAERVFTSGINAQLRSTLGVETDRHYRVLSFDVHSAWKLDNDQHVMERHVGATDDLRYAMALNPHMQVLVTHGLFDLVTPYFASERIVRQMKLRPEDRERLTVQHFRGGHMFYTVEQSRSSFRDAGERFIRSALG